MKNFLLFSSLSLFFSFFCIVSSSLAQGQLINDSAFSLDSSRTMIPACSSDSLDTDGDGWGWENMETCHVGGEYEYKVYSNCKSASSDPDGDGWGFENGESCKVVENSSDISEENSHEEAQPSSALKFKSLNTNIQNGSVVIEFEFYEGRSAFVEYGFDADNLEFTGPVERSSLIYHRQTINNLERGQTYYYAINSDGLLSSTKSFNIPADNFNDEPVLNEPAFDEPVIEQATSQTTTPVFTTQASGKFLNATSNLQSSRDPDNGSSVPGYLNRKNGQIANTNITRVTSNNAFGTSNGKARHQYSRRQAWNINETKLLVGGRILDGTNHSILGRSSLTSEQMWSTVEPNILFGIRANPKKTHFARYNVQTNSVENIRSFNDYESCTIGDYEGVLSDGDEFVLLACTDGNNKKDLISLDIKNNKILGTVRAHSNFNWGGFSRSGKYILVENNPPGSDKSLEELIRYDKNLSNSFKMPTDRAHGDFGYDVNGDDVFVMISWDYIFYIRLKDAVVVNLTASNRMGDGHVSCRAYKRPGWCYFSSTSYGYVGAVKVGIDPSINPNNSDGEFVHSGYRRYKGLAQLELWGKHHSTGDSYDAQAKLSVSPSGRKIIFTSDWWGRGEINDYVISLD